jgi:hypothetical protein
MDGDRGKEPVLAGSSASEQDQPAHWLDKELGAPSALHKQFNFARFGQSDSINDFAQRPPRPE